MKRRVVSPEILDHLPADDPEALRSRQDLRRVNWLMGNERWICRTVINFPAVAGRGIAEIGAGDGALCGKLARLFPLTAVAAYDLAPRPADLEPSVAWQRGDIFDAPRQETGGILVANLFLHHFKAEELAALGRWMRGFGLLVFNEPDRSRLPHLLGWLARPFINRVTRHDMHVSIDAGFTAGEMARLLGLDGWQTCESSTWRGARRLLAWRD
jgi:SAM-dependent methyltransferase